MRLAPLFYLIILNIYLIISLYTKVYITLSAVNTKVMCRLRIKEIAKERKVTMAQLSEACGYGQPSSFNQAMSRGLKVQQLEAIARRLGVDVPDLFERTRTTIQCPHCGRIIKIKTDD